MSDKGFDDYEEYLADICSGEIDPEQTPYKSETSWTDYEDDDEEDNKIKSNFNLERVVKNIINIAVYKGYYTRIIEETIGVSGGYFHRLLAKKSNPSIKVLMAVAEFLEVSLEDLILHDLSKPCDFTEHNAVTAFMEILALDTQEGKIAWDKVKLEEFEGMNVYNPLVTQIGFDGESCYTRYLPEGVFHYKASKVFKSQIKDDAVLYLIIGNINDECDQQIDLALLTKDKKAHKIASTVWGNEEIRKDLTELYHEAQSSSKSVHLNSKVVSIMDNFLEEF